MRRLQPHLHLYGHTHIPLGTVSPCIPTSCSCCSYSCLTRLMSLYICLSAADVDLELEGIRYLQWPLGYFREAHLQCAPIFSSGPLAVHDSALGNGSAGTQHLSCILH